MVEVKKDLHITVEDGTGNRFFVHGKIGGFTLKTATKKKSSAVVVGLDSNWAGKKVLCILVEDGDAK